MSRTVCERCFGTGREDDFSGLPCINCIGGLVDEDEDGDANQDGAIDNETAAELARTAQAKLEGK